LKAAFNKTPQNELMSLLKAFSDADMTEDKIQILFRIRSALTIFLGDNDMNSEGSNNDNNNYLGLKPTLKSQEGSRNNLKESSPFNKQLKFNTASDEDGNIYSNGSNLEDDYPVNVLSPRSATDDENNNNNRPLGSSSSGTPQINYIKQKGGPRKRLNNNNNSRSSAATSNKKMEEAKLLKAREKQMKQEKVSSGVA
jgi:hypothetical protein